MTRDGGATGIVLAGGAASRFGADKLAAVYDGRTLLDRALGAAEAVCDELVVVVGQGAAPPDTGTRSVPIRVIHDPEPHRGPRAGLLAGIDAATRPLALVVGGDMPWLRPPFLRALLDRLASDQRGASAPILYGVLRPLPCAVRVAAVRARSPRRDGSMLALLETLEVAPLAELAWRPFDPDGESLQDVDRPEDLAGPVELPVRGWVATWAHRQVPERMPDEPRDPGSPPDPA